MNYHDHRHDVDDDIHDQHYVQADAMTARKKADAHMAAFHFAAL